MRASTFCFLDSICLLRCRLFGKGTTCDFAAIDIGGRKGKARELEESQEGTKKVTPKVINLIDR
jgi:hypothetical protein